MLCGRYLLALCVSFGALTLSPRVGMAQTIVRPNASVLWVAAPGPPQTGASRSVGPVRERNPLIGGGSLGAHSALSSGPRQGHDADQ